MTHFIYTESNSFDPYFNQSFVKYLFDNAQEEDIIFHLWRNERTVILGKNKSINDDCNKTSLLQLGGKLARSKAEDETIYQDLGCLNFAFIAKNNLFDADRQFEIITDAISQFGLPATRAGNDVEILGKKFSKNNLYTSEDKNLQHGTLHVNIDKLILQNVLSNNTDTDTINLYELSSDITIESLVIALKDAFLHKFKAEDFTDTIIAGGKSIISITGLSDWSASGSMLAMLQTLSSDQKHFQSDEWIYNK